MKRRLALLISPAVIGWAGCVVAGLPGDAVPLTPPAVYQQWWAITEACSGLHAPIDSVRWYQAPAASIRGAEGRNTIAYWTSNGNRILLGNIVVTSGPAVRHEMLHALSRQHGHPRELFLGRCAGVVDCEAQCQADAGPVSSVPTDPIQVPLESLTVAISSFPVAPSAAQFDGHFQLTVTATNPARHRVAVRFRSIAPAFSLLLAPGDWKLTGDRPATDPSFPIFEAGETKRFVFDLRVGGLSERVPISPGVYTVVGAFGDRQSLPMVLTIP